MRFILIGLIVTYCQFYSFSQCYKAGQKISSGYTLITSGYAELDKIVFEEINRLQIFFGVKIDFFYLKENYDENAFYNPSCEYNCNGSVFLGYNMLNKQLKKEHGIECVKAILAHEFGHCVQHLMNWKELGKWRELHSDFMAGYYMGSIYQHSDSEVDALFKEFFSMGDTEYFRPGHHGTHQERQCAFLEGYFFAKESNTTVATANTYGVQYVVANNPCGVRKYIKKINELTNQYNQDLKDNNVGSLNINCLNSKKKYHIELTNYDGTILHYYLNTKKINFNNNGYKSTMKFENVYDEHTIPNLSANFQYNVSVYEITSRSQVLKEKFQIIPKKNKTLYLNYDKEFNQFKYSESKSVNSANVSYDIAQIITSKSYFNFFTSKKRLDFVVTIDNKHEFSGNYKKPITIKVDNLKSYQVSIKRTEYFLLFKNTPKSIGVSSFWLNSNDNTKSYDISKLDD
jgi:hypothetical protein